MADNTALMDSIEKVDDGTGDEESVTRTNEIGDSKIITIQIPKILIVAELVIGAIMTFICAIMVGDAWWHTRSWYVLGIFVGLYLIIDSVFRGFKAIAKTDVEIKFGDKSFKLVSNSKWNGNLRSGVDFLIAVVMFVTFIVLDMFTVANVLGIICAIILLAKGVRGLTLSKTGRLGWRGSFPASTSSNRLKSIVEQMEADVEELRHGFVSFNDEATATSIMKGKRGINFLTIFICQLCCILVVVTDQIFVRDDNRCEKSSDYATCYIYTALGDMSTSMRYWLWISCGSLFILSSWLMAGIFKPSLLANFVVSCLSLGSGIYFALLSSASMMSFAYLRKDLPDFVYRCLQHFPISIIAVLLIVFGLSTGLANVRLEENSRGMLRMILTNMICFLVACGALVSSTFTQHWTKIFLEQHWNATNAYYDEEEPDVRLSWRYKDSAGTYLGIQTGLASAVAIIALLNVFIGQRKLPGLIKWFISAVTLALCVLASWNLVEEQRSEYFEIDPSVLVMNGLIVGIAGLAGVPGIFVYSPAVLAAFVSVARCLRLLMLSIGFLCYRLFSDIAMYQRRFIERVELREAQTRETKKENTTEVDDKNLGNVTEINERN